MRIAQHIHRTINCAFKIGQIGKPHNTQDTGLNTEKSFASVMENNYP